MVADYMKKPIKNVADAESFIRALHADGKLFHFDDEPRTIIKNVSGRPTFDRDECPLVRLRVHEMRALDGFDPFELALELTA